MWTVAGILVVNAVMVTLTVIGIRIQDEEKKRLQSFYAAPVKPVKIALYGDYGGSGRRGTWQPNTDSFFGGICYNNDYWFCNCLESF